VVFGVIELAAAAGDDAPRAAVARSRRRHRVLAVIAALVPRQARFAVIECPAVIEYGYGPPALINASVSRASAVTQLQDLRRKSPGRRENE